MIHPFHCKTLLVWSTIDGAQSASVVYNFLSMTTNSHQPLQLHQQLFHSKCIIDLLCFHRSKFISIDVKCSIFHRSASAARWSTYLGGYTWVWLLTRKVDHWTWNEIIDRLLDEKLYRHDSHDRHDASSARMKNQLYGYDSWMWTGAGNWWMEKNHWMWNGKTNSQSRSKKRSFI